MRRFVVLHHETPPGYARGPHYDLMLEWPADEAPAAAAPLSGEGAAGLPAVLRTWALRELPTPGRWIPAEPLADHRREYLDYEGPVRGGRGRVTRCDAGTYELLEHTQQALRVRLRGQRLRGILLLEEERSPVRGGCQPAAEEGASYWRARFSSDG